MSDGSLYASKIVWILFFIALYWAFCLFWGTKSAARARTAADFFIAGRQLPVWVFIMAATATSFAGWIFIGQPALVLRDGFQASYLSFAAIVIPLSGVLLLKRQWMLGKRYGYVTPGEMFAGYFQGDIVRVFSVVVAVLFAVPFLALLLGASGFLVSLVTEGWLSRDTAMWSLSVVLLIYVTLGGLRAVAYINTLQTLLLGAGTLILGLAVVNLLGGFDAINQALSLVAQSPAATWGTTQGYGGGDYNSLFAVPGVVQWTDGLGRETPVGGPWTGLMIMTFLFAFLGVQASPAFSMWAYASRDPRAFAPQQVWASACAAGLLLFIFATLEGLGGILLGANPAVRDAGLAVAPVLPALGDGREGEITAVLINLVGQTSPWLVGVLTVCLLATIKAGAGAYMASAGAIVTRDLYMRFFNSTADARLQKAFSRVMILILTVLALLMATFARDGVMVLGALALSFAVQLLPALVAVTWVPWFTRRGISAGVIVGGIVVILTDPVGQAITGGALPWGQWPWTIHAAVWGLAANLLVCVLGSVVTQTEVERGHRDAFHRFLNEHAGLAPRKRRLSSLAWSVTFAWIFFAIGPGIVLGNHLFGPPVAGYDGWDFAMPSIWAWQLIWWGLGVLLIWFLAYKMELATVPARDVIALQDDVAAPLGGATTPSSSPR